MPDLLIFPGLSFTWLSSARVMRDESGGSRGFGFVSYHEPEHGKIYLFDFYWNSINFFSSC
jgi:hypothetical protein